MLVWFRSLWTDLLAPSRERRELDDYTAALRRDQDERFEEWKRRREETRDAFEVTL